MRNFLFYKLFCLILLLSGHKPTFIFVFAVAILKRDDTMIRNLALPHTGGYYNYRVHIPKTEKLCNGYSGLKEHLNEMFAKCPDDYFNVGPRSSKLKFNLPLDVKRVSGHEICGLAGNGLKENKERYKGNHSRVQVYLLERDNKTIAVEVPVWMGKEEIDDYKEIFQSDFPLTGHVDIVRVEDGKIWIWDYKPNAFEERFASTQVYFYALMMSKRCKIPLNDFRCGYFDQEYAFIFNPGYKLNALDVKLAEI